MAGCLIIISPNVTFALAGEIRSPKDLIKYEEE